MFLTPLPYAALTEHIVRGFHETVQELGCGFGEHVCQRALQIVLHDRGLRVERKYPLTVTFRGKNIGTFEPDLLVERLVIVEVKATPTTDDWAKAQLLNYLKVAGGGIGFIANFGRARECKRLVMGNPHNSLPGIEKFDDVGKWTKAIHRT